MKTLFFLFIIISPFIITNSYSQVIEDFSTSVNTYEIKDGAISETSSGKTIYILENNIIKDGKSGKTLYTISNGVLRNTSKKSLYKYVDGIVSEISTGKKLYEITDSGVIKSWSMGTGFYRITGGFGAGELFMTLLATGLL
jgi:hypothetical protein